MPAAETTTATTFGDLLKFLRKRAGLTQRELGIAVGYAETQITRLEGNTRPPDPVVVRAPSSLRLSWGINRHRHSS